MADDTHYYESWSPESGDASGHHYRTIVRATRSADFPFEERQKIQRILQERNCIPANDNESKNFGR